MEEILQLIRKHDSNAELMQNAHPPTVSVRSDVLVDVARDLHTSSSSYFDQLSCVTGIDNGPEANTMEVIYHLYSIPHNISLALRVILPREQPSVDSLCGIWKSANWLER